VLYSAYARPAAVPALCRNITLSRSEVWRGRTGRRAAPDDDAERRPPAPRRRLLLLPLLVPAAALALWAGLAALRVFPPSAFPTPAEVARCLADEARGGSLFDDVVASLFRVGVGFTLSMRRASRSACWWASAASARAALLPAINFLRCLSPLAWIPFAILWFGIGDAPTIFLIFLSAVFPLALATAAAVANIPAVPLPGRARLRPSRHGACSPR
jgi:NitT/TauT family transport system permease protein